MCKRNSPNKRKKKPVRDGTGFLTPQIKIKNKNKQINEAKTGCVRETYRIKMTAERDV